MHDIENLTELVAANIDRDALREVCEADERSFASRYDMDYESVPQKQPADFYNFRDNGSDILAVAHLDTVGLAHERDAHFIETQAGPVIYSRALDDRLGAYILLELLPTLGINYDILLTVGEEDGRSTAQFFEPPKEYNWMIEFDRGGTDVVMYQYHDDYTEQLVRDTGALVGDGIFSDISYMEHLGIKGFNWGVGYRDYHGPRAHAYLDDTAQMVAHFLRFHEENANIAMPHEEREEASWWTSYGRWDDEDTDPEAPWRGRECDLIFGTDHLHDAQDCDFALREIKCEWNDRNTR